MKWSKGVAHLVGIAGQCDELNERVAHLGADRILSFWAYGPVLDGPDAWPESHSFTQSALAFGVPPERLPWFARPPELENIGDLMGWGKRPVSLMFRSADLPIWNHRIVRPLRLWDSESGVDEVALDALESGDVEAARQPAPSDDELRVQLEHEQQISYAAMVKTTNAYDENRWGRDNLRLRAEPMWEAAAGYVDLTEALAAR